MLRNLNKKRAVLFTVIGFVVGFLFFVGLRAVLIQDLHTHYHANFALFVDDQRDQFNNFTFYEEVQSCSAQDENPIHRVHMHNKENHVIHVHDDAVTWGQFFANLGYGLTNKSITTDKGVFVDGAEGKKITFFLNRQPVESIANRVIESKDSLLIDYGDGSDIDGKYGQIKQDAGEYNIKPDPVSCAGKTELTLSERLKRAFDFKR
jgi:hypothetical protein